MKRTCLLTIISVLAVYGTAGASTYTMYQTRFLETAAQEEQDEGDRSASRVFKELADIARTGRPVTVDDLPEDWRKCRCVEDARDPCSRQVVELEELIASMSDFEIEANAERVACAVVDLLHARHELSERRGRNDSRRYITHARGDLANLGEGELPLEPEPEPEPEAAPDTELIPSSAKPGECYARVYVPPKTRTETVRMVKREASCRFELIPAKYEWVEEKVLVKEASTRVEEIPAKFETVEDTILDVPAHTLWQRGCMGEDCPSGAIGDVWCLVEVPAKYKTVQRSALKTPATTREIPVPAEYETVRVQRLVSGAQVKRIDIPAEHVDVTKEVIVEPGRFEWQQVLCETNLTEGRITQIQEMLKKVGHDPGAINGQLTKETMIAIDAFQKANGLATGALTVETVQALERMSAGS
jgi:hypothetical protein